MGFLFFFNYSFAYTFLWAAFINPFVFFFPSFWLDHFTLTFSGGKQVQQWQCEEILMEEKEIIFLDPINIFNFGGEIRDPSIFAPQKQHTLHPNNFPPSIFGFGD